MTSTTFRQFLSKSRLVLGLVGLSFTMAAASAARADDKEVAFKIAGKATSIGEVYTQDQASFYDLEKKKFDLIDRIAKEKYLEYFWSNLAKEQGKSVAEAQKAYEDKNLKVSEKELKETLEKFKDHPSLAKLDKKEQEKQVRDYLGQRGRQELADGIIEGAIKKGDLVIAFPEPKEPIYQVTVNADDHVRYGPEVSDVKPAGCKADDCAITIVEYSEFQCPFCTRVLPDVKRVLTDYKGKIR